MTTIHENQKTTVVYVEITGVLVGSNIIISFFLFVPLLWNYTGLVVSTVSGFNGFLFVIFSTELWTRSFGLYWLIADERLTVSTGESNFLRDEKSQHTNMV